jgi:hypothetical protein
MTEEKKIKNLTGYYFSLFIKQCREADPSELISFQNFLVRELKGQLRATQLHEYIGCTIRLLDEAIELRQGEYEASTSTEH